MQVSKFSIINFANTHTHTVQSCLFSKSWMNTQNSQHKSIGVSKWKHYICFPNTQYAICIFFSNFLLNLDGKIQVSRKTKTSAASLVSIWLATEHTTWVWLCVMRLDRRHTNMKAMRRDALVVAPRCGASIKASLSLALPYIKFIEAQYQFESVATIEHSNTFGPCTGRRTPCALAWHQVVVEYFAN